MGRARREPRQATAFAVSLFGVATFTFFAVTARFPNLLTEFGIYIALLGLLLRPRELKFPTALLWAAVFLLWALVTSFLAVSPETALTELIERLKALVIFFVVVNTLRTPQQVRFYVLLIIVAFMIYPGRGTLQSYVAGSTYMGRANWNRQYANPNDLAAITVLMLGLVLAIATVKVQTTRVRWAAVLCVPVMLLIIFLTQSRGVFLGLLAGFAVPVLARIRKRPVIAGPLLIVAIVLAVVVPTAAWDRLQNITKVTSSETIGQADKYGSATQRLEILKTGWRIFESNPVFGVGIGCYNEANARYAPGLGKHDAHNTYINLAAEMGLPGLLLWLGLVGSVLAQVRRRRRAIEADDRTIQALWIQRAVIGFLVAGFFATYSGLTVFYLVLGTLSSAASVLGRTAPETNAPPVRRGLRAR